MTIKKEILDKVYQNISKKLDNCFYKNCKKGNCGNSSFLDIKHEKGKCSVFFKAVHDAIWRTYEDLLFTNYPERKIRVEYDEVGNVTGKVDLHNQTIAALKKINVMYTSPVRSQFEEEVKLESK